MDKLHDYEDAPKIMPLQLLCEITNNFSEECKLGSGTYGEVFKGVHNGEDVAVKKLRQMPGLFNDLEQFKKEFENLMSLRHENTVRLLGYCYETKHEYVVLDDGRGVFAENIYRALCFEYMHNGSLQNHLYDEYHGLDWQTRYRIIKGICEGLRYLHEEFECPIYHLDLKPDNILLDKAMVPKLADFGLAKLVHNDQTQATGSSLGTMGYLPPEYIEGNLVSKKFDIFSLGVVMLRIMTGYEGYHKKADMSSQEFIDLVLNNWRNRLQATLGCSSLEDECHQVKRCTEIALDCVKADRKQRPEIGAIIHQLNETEHLISTLGSTHISKLGDNMHQVMLTPIIGDPAPKAASRQKNHGSASQPRQADWAAALDAATQRRMQVLASENLENMWTIGRNYQKKIVKAEHSSKSKCPGGLDSPNAVAAGKELSSMFNERTTSVDDKYMVNLMQGTNRNAQSTFVTGSHPLVLHNTNEVKSKEGSRVNFNSKEKPLEASNSAKAQLKWSNSIPDIEKKYFAKSNQTVATSESLGARKNPDAKNAGPAPDVEVALLVPKIRCRVVDAYLEKFGLKSYAVYFIAVADADNKTWFVERRYSNFERLHRQLKEIPNYSLHLPPKSFLSSNFDDYPVHQRCILLNKYLEDLLSIANIKAQHEVWDFLSASSKVRNERGNPNVINAGTVSLAHDGSPCKRASQGFQMESRNSPAEPSGFVPANNSGTRSLVACEARKSEAPEDDHGSASQPRQPY